MLGKECTKCAKVMEEKDLIKDIHVKSGFKRVCKTCHNLYKRNYRNTKTGRLSKLLNAARDRSAQKDRAFNIDLKHLKDLLKHQQGKCCVTGIKLDYMSKNSTSMMNNSVSIDRIDSSKGYVKGNVHLVCLWVNIMRNDLNLDEFKQRVELLHKSL